MARQSNLRIAKVQSWILRIPTIRAHTLSVATMHDQRLVILEITDSEGRTGIGEATTIGGLAYTEESPDSIKLTIDKYLVDHLLGRPVDPALTMPPINKAIVGNYFAKNAVEIALFDLLGQFTEKPISDLLGTRNKDALPVAWTLASGDTTIDIAEGRAMIEARRHRIFKLKIGKRYWREDVEHVGTIVDALGDETSIRVDVNQAWSRQTASQAIPALAEAGVELIEQPLDGTDYEGARELRALSKAVIMADEALRGGVHQARQVIRHEAADVLSLKIAQTGGLTACREVASLAMGAGLALYGGTMLEGSVGTIASAQLFATLPDFAWGTELFGPLLLTHDIVNEPPVYRDFALQVPAKPGLGVTLNHAVIDEFAES